MPSSHTSPNRLTTGPSEPVGYEILRLLAFLADTFDDEVRFGGLKAGQINIETNIDEMLQFDRKNLVIPAGLFRQPIVGNDVGLLLCFSKMREPYAGTVFIFSCFAAKSRP